MYEVFLLPPDVILPAVEVGLEFPHTLPEQDPDAFAKLEEVGFLCIVPIGYKKKMSEEKETEEKGNNMN